MCCIIMINYLCTSNNLLDLTAAEARLIISLKLNDDLTPNAF